MRFDDLIADHSVAAIRKTKWANKEDRLELPKVIEGVRGPWCALIAFDGFSVEETQMLDVLCRDDDDDWEPWKKA
jgi:hypothetical protein